MSARARKVAKQAATLKHLLKQVTGVKKHRHKVEVAAAQSKLAKQRQNKEKRDRRADATGAVD